MSLLSDFIGRVESGNNPNASLTDYAGNVSVNAQYQQSAAYVQTWGSGASGIDNQAQSLLTQNPNATLGDFYSLYNHGSVLPWGTYSSTYSLQANNFLNNANNYGYGPNTPLSTLVGNNTTSTANDPLGYSLTVANPGTEDAPSESQWSYIPNDSFDTTSTALGNDQGTPNLGGGITSPSLGSQGQVLPGQQNTGEASIAGQAVQSGLGTAGTDVKSGLGTVGTTIANGLNALQTYTSQLFVVIALVVLGVIFVSYGLGLFGKRQLEAIA